MIQTKNGREIQLQRVVWHWSFCKLGGAEKNLDMEKTMTEENFQTFVEQKIEEKRQAENSKSTRLDLARVRHAQVVSYLELCMGKISELKINGFSDSEIYSAVCSFAPKSLIPTRKEYMLFLYGFPEKKNETEGARNMLALVSFVAGSAGILIPGREMDPIDSKIYSFFFWFLFIYSLGYLLASYLSKKYTEKAYLNEVCLEGLSQNGGDKKFHKKFHSEYKI